MVAFFVEKRYLRKISKWVARSTSVLGENKMVFLDESGHTGTIKYDSGKWNTNEQPLFVLVAIILDENKREVLYNEIDLIKKRYRIQHEIKSTHKTVRKNIEKISIDLEKILNAIEAQIRVEVVNKKYCIAKQIVDYCIIPYYDSPINDEKGKFVRQIFANYIYEHIDDALLGKIVEIFDSNRKDIDELLKVCTELKNMMRLETLKLNIEETIDTINRYEAAGLKKDNLFPLADRYKGGISTVSICPHVDSFNNIVLSYPKETIFVHDEISDMELALSENTKGFLKLYNRNIQIKFDKSSRNQILQISDIFAGNIRLYIDSILNDKCISHVPEIFVKTVYDSTNFVAPYNEQCKVFPRNKDLQILKYYYDDYVMNESSYI